MSADVAASAGFSTDSNNLMGAYANVAMTGLVDGVTFTFGWENADDLQGVDPAELDMGDIFLSAEIAY